MDYFWKLNCLFLCRNVGTASNIPARYVQAGIPVPLSVLLYKLYIENSIFFILTYRCLRLNLLLLAMLIDQENV